MNHPIHEFIAKTCCAKITERENQYLQGICGIKTSKWYGKECVGESGYYLNPQVIF